MLLCSIRVKVYLLQFSRSTCCKSQPPPRLRLSTKTATTLSPRILGRVLDCAGAETVHKKTFLIVASRTNVRVYYVCHTHGYGMAKQINCYSIKMKRNSYAQSNNPITLLKAAHEQNVF